MRIMEYGSEELKRLADEKWQAFYRASSAAGIWLVAFIAALALATTHTPGVLLGSGLVFIGALVLITMCMSVTLGVLMIGAMLEAQTATRRASDARGKAPSVTS